MKKVVVLVMSLFMVMSISSMVFAEEKKIDSVTLQQIKIKLERLHAIETATPEFKISGIEVVQDSDGKFYVKDKAKTEVKILPDLVFAGEVPVKADVKLYMTKDKSPFISHFGILYGITADMKDKNKMDMGQLHLTYTSLTFKRLTLETPFNTKNWGLGLGWRAFSHTKVVFGGLVKWGEKVSKDTVTPYVGVGVNF